MYDAFNKINSKMRESNPLHEFISKKLNDDEDTAYFVECDTLSKRTSRYT